MSEPVTIVLKTPIMIGKENPVVVTELTIRPLKAKDLRGLQQREGYETDFMLALAGRLSGQPNHVIDELEAQDLKEVAAVVTGFLSGTRVTGSDPSP